MTSIPEGGEMKFEMTKPCDNCPFRVDCLRGWLGEDRAQEIIDSLLHQQQSFPCHKTTQHDDDGERIMERNEQHCAGAMILLEKLEQPNQMMRICERLNMYDHRKLEMDAPIFDDECEFVEHHATY